MRNEFQQLLLLLHKDVRKRYTLKELSERFLISETYISKLFQKEVGYNFTKYYHEVKIAQAINCLKQQDSPERIAKRVGYSDARYFSTLFKKYTGKTLVDFSSSY
jgi:two-component system response regulator YesN